VDHHHHPLQAHAEGETGVTGGIDSHSGKDRRIDHPAAADFDPFLALDAEAGNRHVDLEAGFGEGEEMGPETDPGLRTEELAEKEFHGALQVGQADPFIDHQGFQLGEKHAVGGVDLIPPETTARGDDFDRGLFFLHRADLHGGGVGAEQSPPQLSRRGKIEVEGVLFVARRVVGGGVQGVEVVEFGVDFRPGGEGESHAAEDVDAAVHQAGDGVPGAEG